MLTTGINCYKNSSKNLRSNLIVLTDETKEMQPNKNISKYPKVLGKEHFDAYNAGIDKISEEYNKLIASIK